MNDTLTPTEKEQLFQYMNKMTPSYSNMDEFGVDSEILVDTAKDRLMYYVQDTASNMLYDKKS